MESKNDRRESQRVPVLPGGTLFVSLVRRGDEKFCSPTPINISTTGILLEFSKGVVPDLPNGSTVSLRLLHLEAGGVVNAVVVHRPSATRFGLQFLEEDKAVAKIVKAEMARWEAASPEERSGRKDV